MVQRSLTATALFLVLLAIGVDSTASIAGADTAPSLLLRVTDGAGRPVAGATVRAAWVPMPEETEPILRATTSPKGTARLDGLPADREVCVGIEKAGFTPEIRTFSSAVDAPRELTVALRPGSVAFGRVVDEEGRPVAGVEVELSGLPSGFTWNPPPNPPPGLRDLAQHRVRSTRAGRFRFRDLPAGELRLTFRHPGYPVLYGWRLIEGGTTRRLGTFVLRRGVTLRGTVTDAAGQPVAGASVWGKYEGLTADLPPADTVTGADGRFAVPGLPPETAFFLRVCAEGFLQEMATLPFPEEPVQVALEPAAAVRGRVLGPDGAPQPGATVRADPAHPWPGSVMDMQVYSSPCPPEKSVPADAEGRFAFGRLEPGGFTLVATAEGLQPGTSAPLQLEAGTPVEDVEIRLHEGAAVAGRVLDPDGAPVPGARLTIWIGRTEIAAFSAADGEFRLAGLPLGNRRIQAWAERFQSRQVEIDVTADEVTADVVLEPVKDPIEVSGRILGPDGAAVEDALVSVYNTRVSSARDGSFVLRVDHCHCDRPQEVTIAARKRGFAEGRTTVLLDADRIDGVVVPLETGVRVNGRVLGLDAADLPFATVTLSLPPKNHRGQEQLDSSHLDAAGRFQLGPIPAGTWLIEAHTGSRRVAQDIVLDPGQTEATVDLTIPQVWKVSGRVLNPDGRPAARASLAISTAAGERLGVGWTHSDGTFSVRVPAGDLTLLVNHQGLSHQQALRVGNGPLTGVEIRMERAPEVPGVDPEEIVDH